MELLSTLWEIYEYIAIGGFIPLCILIYALMTKGD